MQPVTLNLWKAPPSALCDEHAAEGVSHPAVYCVTVRRARKQRSVLCVCRDALEPVADRLLGGA